jgi:hypothetical protein
MKPKIIKLLLLIPVFGLGQAALHRPANVENQSFLRHTMSNFSTPTAGKNQIWDFRTALLDQRPARIRLIANTSEDTIFITHTDGQTVYYNFLHGNQYAQIQHEKNYLRISHNTPRILLNYPLHFQQSFNSRFDGTLYRALDQELPIKSESNVKLVGYGSLILPNEEIVNDVFLVRAQVRHGQTEEDLLERVQTIYAFYTSESVMPIIEIFHQTHHAYFYELEQMLFSAPRFSAPSAQTPPHSVPENIIPATSFASIAPNPTTNKITVTLDLQEAATVFWEIHTLQGRQVHADRWDFPMRGVFRQNLFLNNYNLTSGMYIITIRINGNVETHKIQKI